MDYLTINVPAPTSLNSTTTLLKSIGSNIRLDVDEIETIWTEFNRYKKTLALSAYLNEQESFAKHIYESTLLAVIVESFSASSIRVCDLGTGNGFPGLILKSIYTNWTFSFFEAGAKRAAYLENVLSVLKNKNASVENVFLDKIPTRYHSAFDLITHRAFASKDITLRLTETMGTTSHSVAGFLSSLPEDGLDLSHKYKIDRLIEFRNYKNKPSYAYAASIVRSYQCV